jgi:hypothetical protein
MAHLARLRQSTKVKHQTDLATALRQATTIVESIDQHLSTATPMHAPDRFEIPLSNFGAAGDPIDWQSNPVINALVLVFLRRHTGMDVRVGEVSEPGNDGLYFIFTEPMVTPPAPAGLDLSNLSNLDLSKVNTDALREWFAGSGRIRVEAEHTGVDGQVKAANIVLSHGTDKVTGARTFDLNAQVAPKLAKCDGCSLLGQPTTVWRASRPCGMRAPPPDSEVVPPKVVAAIGFVSPRGVPKKRQTKASAMKVRPVGTAQSPLTGLSATDLTPTTHTSVEEASKNAADMIAILMGAPEEVDEEAVGAEAGSAMGWTKLDPAKE